MSLSSSCSCIVKSGEAAADEEVGCEEDGASNPLRVILRRYEVCAEMRVSRVASGYGMLVKFESGVFFLNLDKNSRSV